MTEHIHFNSLGHFADGGIATLTRIVLEDGHQAILRELQSSKLLSLKQQMTFRRGMQIRAALSPHPNLANSMEFGVHGLKPYEIIEYVEGRNLKALMSSHDPFLQNNLMFIITECAEALAWVHSNGFMHLDVKPENFLIKTMASQPVVKLTDFDLARQATWNAPHKQMGTPAYMAPEQFRSKTASQASDVFAFSVMVYQLVTGKQPFVSSTQKGSLKKQASESYIPTPPKEHNPSLSPKLNTLIMEGLEKKASKRIPNMSQFLSQLKG